MVPSSPSKTLVLRDKLKPLPCVKRDLLKMLTTPFFSPAFLLPSRAQRCYNQFFSQRPSSKFHAHLPLSSSLCEEISAP